MARMTKAEADRKYKEKMKCWKNRNYDTFCFHLPKKMLKEFRKLTKINGDVQRQLVIEMIEKYNKKGVSNNGKKTTM